MEHVRESLRHMKTISGVGLMEAFIAWGCSLPPRQSGCCPIKPEIFLLVPFLVSCATSPAGSPNQVPELITAKPAELFTHGPSQPGRPEKLQAGEFVTPISWDSGYQVVRLEDGRTGWVDAASLRPAPPLARAADEDEVFPEKAAERNALLFPPEPDLKKPVEDVVSTVAPPAEPKPKKE